jgi:hypothetical protein
VAVNYLSHPENEQTIIISVEPSAEEQHPVTEAIRTKQQRQEQLIVILPREQRPIQGAEPQATPLMITKK